MPFVVPKFIEMESKIVGPFSLKQIFYVIVAAAISFFLYFPLGKTHFFFFVMVVVGLFVGALALAFMKPDGRPLPTILKNIFYFYTKPKLYIFRKNIMPPKLISKKEGFKPYQDDKKETVLEIARKSRLRRLSSAVETRIK